MTDDILNKLTRADTVSSLQMEEKVAQSFRALKWEAQRSAYYIDLSTGKSREIDVYARRVIHRRGEGRVTGRPIINLNVVCECKSLSGLNAIFALDAPPARLKGSRRQIQQYSMSDDIELRKFTLALADHIMPHARNDLSSIYKYVLGRVFLNGDEVSIKNCVDVSLSSVDLETSSYRETKVGEDNKEPNKKNPLWDAVQSVLSSSKAVLKRSEDASRS